MVSQRKRRLFLGLGLAVALALAVSPASASAVSTLTGESVSAISSSGSSTNGCGGHATYNVSGTATGPYPGTFTESGSFNLFADGWERTSNVIRVSGKSSSRRSSTTWPRNPVAPVSSTRLPASASTIEPRFSTTRQIMHYLPIGRQIGAGE